jgi:hypothetical protein
MLAPVAPESRCPRPRTAVVFGLALLTAGLGAWFVLTLVGDLKHAD